MGDKCLTTLSTLAEIFNILRLKRYKQTIKEFFFIRIKPVAFCLWDQDNNWSKTLLFALQQVSNNDSVPIVY